jgi:tetratricopeptide (TPR) repeat protein
VSSSLLGLALMRLGTEQEGLRLLEDSVAMSRQLGVNAYLAAWMVNLAEGQLAAGQSENALATAQEALALAVDGGERGHEAHALWLLGSTRKALESYEKALGIALDLEMLPLAAQTHLDFGRQLAVAGDKIRADQQTILARQLFKKMGMRPWYDQSQTGSREIGHLYIVARSNPQLYEFLTQEFSGARGIKIVLDRRERGQRGTGHGDDRRHQEVDADLRTWDLALMPAGRPAGADFGASLH